jgi:hypothetical protein
VVVGLDELIRLSMVKKERPRLAEQKIHVTGMGMEKFVPPIWKPRKSMLGDQRRNAETFQSLIAIQLVKLGTIQLQVLSCERITMVENWKRRAARAHKEKG